MRKWKKAISLTLALALSFALAVPAFAAEGTALTCQQMLAKLPTPVPPGDKPKTLREAEYLSTSDFFPPYSIAEWDAQVAGMSKEAAFQQIVSLTESLTAGKSSDTEKAKAIYQWVAKNIKYDFPVKISDDFGGIYLDSSPDNTDAFYTFALRLGVCEGYSRLCYLMLRLAGLSGALVVSNEANHMWNAVYADGKWLMFDATNKMWDLKADRYPISWIQYRYGNEIISRTIEKDGAITCNLLDRENRFAEYVIPDAVTRIGTNAFSDCENLTSVVIPGSVTEIGWNAFSGCENLTSVVIPSSVTEIGWSAFLDCKNLTSIVIPGSVTEIGDETFAGCRNLTNVVIQDGVKEIDGTAFLVCDKLTSVSIPASVTRVRLSNYGNALDIYYGGSKEQWEALKWYEAGSKEDKLYTVHYNSIGPGATIPTQPEKPTQPQQPTQPTETKTANPTNDKLVVNGAEQAPTVYKIGGSNYFKIRDVAAVLNGTEKQFAVGYAGGKVTATSGQPYDATGKELAGAPSEAKSATRSNDVILIDGAEASLTVYKVGGSNYFKLRDLGKALDFYVGYSGGQVTIDTSKGYSD